MAEPVLNAQSPMKSTLMLISPIISNISKREIPYGNNTPKLKDHISMADEPILPRITDVDSYYAKRKAQLDKREAELDALMAQTKAQLEASSFNATLKAPKTPQEYFDRNGEYIFQRLAKLAYREGYAPGQCPLAAQRALDKLKAASLTIDELFAMGCKDENMREYLEAPSAKTDPRIERIKSKIATIDAMLEANPIKSGYYGEDSLRVRKAGLVATLASITKN